MRIEAKDLQSALTDASRLLECSVIELEYDIIQLNKKGFLGIGRKNAIIEVKDKKRFQKKKVKKEILNYKFSEKINEKPAKFEPEIKENKTENSQISKEKYFVKNDEIFNTFHKESKKSRNNDDILAEIKIELTRLLESMNFKIGLSELKMYSDDCVLIHLEGEDAALMIGKEAHRYKALSYLLHSWINLKYDFLVRLEIAEFLKNQEQGMQFYLQSVIEKVKQNGKGQTKPLDGVLIKIALEQLRAEFSDKYVGIKQDGEQKFIVIKDFYKKDE